MKIVNRVLTATVALSVLASLAQAQAWLPQPGQLSASLSYHYTDVGDHLFSSDIPTAIGGDGDNSWDLGDITGQSTILSLDYGLGERVALSASGAYVAARYRGAVPESALDDGSWNHGVQDLGLGIRWLAVKLPVTITPALELSLPSHEYDAVGHSALGRNLMEFELATHFGWVSRDFLPGLFAQASYGYLISESIEGKRPNRSEVGLQVGYFVATNVTAWTSASYRHAHDGADWYDELIAGDDPAAHFHTHDQLAKLNATAIGGGLSYSLGSANLSAGMSTTLNGENTHDATSVFITVGRSFNLAR